VSTEALRALSNEGTGIVFSHTDRAIPQQLFESRGRLYTGKLHWGRSDYRTSLQLEKVSYDWVHMWPLKPAK